MGIIQRVKRKVFYVDEYNGDDRVYYGGEWMSRFDAEVYEAERQIHKSHMEWFDQLPEDERDALANGEDF